MRDLRDNEVAREVNAVAEIINRKDFIDRFAQDRWLVLLTLAAVIVTAVGELLSRIADSCERAEQARERTEREAYARQPEDI